MGEEVLSECSISDLKRRRLKLKHAWQHTSGLCCYGSSTGSTNLIWIVMTVAEVIAAGKGMHIFINTGDSVHACVALTGEMTTTCYASSSLAYYAPVTINSDKSCSVP